MGEVHGVFLSYGYVLLAIRHPDTSPRRMRAQSHLCPKTIPLFRGAGVRMQEFLALFGRQ
jgi:hypothetical protein